MPKNSKTKPNDKAHPEIMSEAAESLDGQKYSDTYSYGGLTKRETFAAMAMQGLLSNPALTVSPDDELILEEIAVKAADDLIAELNKEKK